MISSRSCPGVIGLSCAARVLHSGLLCISPICLTRLSGPVRKACKKSAARLGVHAACEPNNKRTSSRKTPAESTLLDPLFCRRTFNRLSIEGLSIDFDRLSIDFQ